MEENLQQLWEDLPEHLWAFLTRHGPTVVWALLTWILGRWIARIARNVVRGVLRRARIDEMIVSFATSILYGVLMLFVIVAVVRRFGVDTNSLVAVIGAAGLAVGFAMQNSLSNFASGVMIILFKPFKKGDFVEAGGTAGVVEEMTIFSTVLKTPDNKRIIVPNSGITGGNVVNYSANALRRVDMVFGIGYGDDVDAAKAVLGRIVAEHPLVLKDPAPVVAMAALADSSVNFHVRPWALTTDYWTVFTDVHEAVKREFDKAGISIPFPQRDVHLHQVA